MTSRRQFLGYSALQAAATMGLSSVTPKTLAADPRKLKQADTPLSSLGRVPIVLIGTGYGNAVTALRLAERGRQVVMLEMGQLWAESDASGNVFCPTLSPDGRSMWNREKTKPPVRSYLNSSFWIQKAIPRHAGVLDLIEYNANMQVYVGRGVGGGSLVNGAMAVTPSRKTFTSVFPDTDVNADEMYEKYFPRANAKLGVNEVDRAWFEQADCYHFSRVARDSAHKAGYKTMFVPSTYDLNYLKKEQAGTVARSALDREVIFGNNAGKRSLDKTYLAEAVGTGNVSIYALHQVTDITELPETKGGGYELTVRQIDKNLFPISTTTLQCDALFLGAGSCGTSELLVRARDKKTLPNLKDNREIGRGWGNNGNIMAARYSWRDPGTLQSTIPLMGINDWDNPNNPVFCEITPLPIGMISFICMYLAITKTPNRGEFIYNGNTDKVSLNWEARQNNYSRNSVTQFLDKINNVPYEKTDYCTHLFDNYTQYGDNYTFHPLGGCILGRATDNYGRIREYPKLYVTDGSLIPGVLGVNPFVTITALAERNIEQILAEDRL